MRKTNILLMSVLAAVLLSSAFALAAADDNISSAQSPAYDPKAVPDAPPTSTTFPYDLQKDFLANQTDNGVNPEPGYAEDQYTLIAPASNPLTPDNTLPIVAIAVALVAIVCGAVGIVYYRKQATKAQE